MLERKKKGGGGTAVLSRRLRDVKDPYRYCPGVNNNVGGREYSEVGPNVIHTRGGWRCATANMKPSPLSAYREQFTSATKYRNGQGRSSLVH